MSWTPWALQSLGTNFAQKVEAASILRTRQGLFRKWGAMLLLHLLPKAKRSQLLMSSPVLRHPMLTVGKAPTVRRPPGLQCCTRTHLGLLPPLMVTAHEGDLVALRGLLGVQ